MSKPEHWCLWNKKAEAARFASAIIEVGVCLFVLAAVVLAIWSIAVVGMPSMINWRTTSHQQGLLEWTSA